MAESDEEEGNKTEYDMYIGAPRSKERGSRADPLAYWKKEGEKLPRMALFARDTHAVAATGARVERLFSTTGKVMDPERNRMSGDTLIKLMYVKNGMVEDGEEFEDELSENQQSAEKEKESVPVEWMVEFLEKLKERITVDESDDEGDDDDE